MSSKKSYKDAAKKRELGGFVALPHAVLRSAEFAGLSPFALKALLDLLAQYRGDNNGDLGASWTTMASRGWRSRDSLGKGLLELRAKSFVVVTRQGGKRLATLYAATFYEVDWCNGKLDMQSPTRAYMGSWRRQPALGDVLPLRRATTILVSRRSCQNPPNYPADRVNSEAIA